MNCGHRLTSEERERAVELFSKGISMRKIAQELHTTHVAISLLIKKFKQHGTTADLPHPGRPSLLTPRDLRVLKLKRTKGELGTARQIQKYIKDTLNITVSPTSISRWKHKHLGESGVKRDKKEKGKEKSSLSAELKKKRMAFAAKCAKWTAQEWERVVFVGETAFSLDPANNSSGSYLPDGAPAVVHTTPKVREDSDNVHVWMAITSVGVLAYELLDGHMTKERYLEILKHTLLPAAKKHFGRQPWILMHNGEPSHTAALVTDFINQTQTRARYTQLVWPACSPDLNPLKDLRRIMDQMLFDLPEPKTKAQERETVESLFTKLQQPEKQSVFQELYDTLPLRMKQVRQRRGALIHS